MTEGRKTGGRTAYTGACSWCGTTKTARWYRKAIPDSVLCRGCYGKHRRTIPEIRVIKARQFRMWGERNRYRLAIKYTRQRNIDFTLTETEYLTLLEKPCYYCAGPLTTTGINLDRVDNTKGYTSTNVVPCCRTCNVAKNTQTIEEFHAWIQRVYKTTIEMT